MYILKSLNIICDIYVYTLVILIASRHKSQVSVNLAFEDSSSDDDAFHVTSQIKGQQEGATYNIIGSHIVQIGTQNTVRNQNKHDIFSVSRYFLVKCKLNSTDTTNHQFLGYADIEQYMDNAVCPNFDRSNYIF